MCQAAETQVHGALIEVLRVGVLLLGASGVGKSECALELVSRGHRLVADDIVCIRRASRGERLHQERYEASRGQPPQSQEEKEEKDKKEEGEPARLVGTAPERIRHYMEIRGIGLLFIPDLYGPDSVRQDASVDLVCQLEPWRDDAEYERIGLERPKREVLGVELPCLVLPVHPARSMAMLVEVAVRDHRNRRSGVNAAARLDERLRAECGRSR